MEREDLPWRSSRQGSAGGRDADQAPNEPTAEAIPQQHTDPSTSDEEKSQVVIFKTHTGERYLWPFELCRSFEASIKAIKPLIDEIYSQRKEYSILLGLISHGEFEIQTEDGAIILPGVWSHVVKPSSTICMDFPRSPFGHANNNRSDPRDSFYKVPERPNDEMNEDGFYQDFGMDAEDTGSQSINPDDSAVSTDASDELTESESEGDNENPERPPETIRDAVAPTDLDGNRLSFGVNTNRQPRSHGDRSDMLKKEGTPETHVDVLRITKAMLAQAEGRNILQIHVLPGPENAQLRQSVSTTWYHIALDQLDFTRFKNVCLTLPHLSDRLRLLTEELLVKVQKDRVKVFLDGMFIEPGTVLRADEEGQPNPQSAIFSCIPYFDLQAPMKRSATASRENLFPSRTLMQSYYPYEPVRERDREQAYRKFGNDRSSGSIIHVPNLWMVNIASDVVVTCGHKPLSKEMVKSITTVEEEIKQLGIRDIKQNTLTSIKVTDWDGRVVILPLNACRSYFQLEQKARELRGTTSGLMYGRSIHFHQESLNGGRRVTPGGWKDAIHRSDFVTISLTLVEKEEDEHDCDQLEVASSTLVPPFFHWPRDNKGQGVWTCDINRTEEYLVQAEKAMVSEILDIDYTTNEVDRTFASTTYYESLQEHTYGEICAAFASVKHRLASPKPPVPHSTHHQIVVDTQCTEIMTRSVEFFDAVHSTLERFVGDADKSAILRKTWGVMANTHEDAVAIEQRGPLDASSDEFANVGWCIRRDGRGSLVPLPDGDARFKKSVRHCRRCRHSTPFSSREKALQHLRQHVESADQVDSTSPQGQYQMLPSGLKLEDWVVNTAQLGRENTNASVLAILTLACELSNDLFTRVKQLSQGVQNEDGRMSELYLLPPQLVDSFRKILVFYMAIERALHYTEDMYQTVHVQRQSHTKNYVRWNENFLEVLKRFGEGARRSLLSARHELCYMVRSDPPTDISKHISFGPEYVCAWLMRRLLVQPLEKHMTVGDMYREYVSTIQFQTNHRPSKRLLRTINLVREELVILHTLTTHQTTLMTSYLAVLSPTSYPSPPPSLSSMYTHTHTHTLVTTCLTSLSLACEDYTDLVRRCGPLGEGTKQSLEINEEDHGKAIMVFTIVTVIFLPLSFVTSYFGMNTADIRDMDARQPLFWAIAVPLTVATVGVCLLVGYNGDEIRDWGGDMYRSILGRRQKRSKGEGRGISVAQRKGVGWQSSQASFADEAEFADPLPEVEYQRQAGTTYAQPVDYAGLETPVVRRAEPVTLNEEIPLRSYAARGQTRGQGYIHDPGMYPDLEYKLRRPVEARRDTFGYGLHGRNGRLPPPPPPPPPPLPQPRRGREYLVEEAMYDVDANGAGGVEEYEWYKKRRRGGIRRRSDRDRDRERYYR